MEFIIIIDKNKRLLKNFISLKESIICAKKYVGLEVFVIWRLIFNVQSTFLEKIKRYIKGNIMFQIDISNEM